MKAKPSVYFLAGVAVAVVLIAGAAALWVVSLRRAAVLKRDLEGRRMALTAAFGRTPFPSVQNVQREKQNAVILRDWYARLAGAASQGQMELEERSPSTFMALLAQTQREFAGRGKDRERLPPDFAFGFDRYFGENSKLPSPEHVPRLTQQLKLTEAICRVLLEENATRLRSLARETFEVDPAADGSVAGAGLVNPRAGLMGPKELYSKFSFSLQFEARESTVMAVLNRLARHELFMVVTHLEFKKLGDDVKPVDRRPSAAAKSAPGAAAEFRRAPTPDRTQNREDRLVCGVAVEAPLLVTMELDVYNFRGVDK